MCVVSMVYDHFNPLIPMNPWPAPAPEPAPESFPAGITMTQWPSFQIISQAEIEAIRALIADFRSAVEAARKVDQLTKQPDCEDPEKKKLEDRVTMLEKQIAQLMQTRKNS